MEAARQNRSLFLLCALLLNAERRERVGHFSHLVAELLACDYDTCLGQNDCGSLIGRDVNELQYVFGLDI